MSDTYKMAADETHVLKVCYDYSGDIDSPRDWDNLGTMICAHGRYDLGDRTFNVDAYGGWDEMRENEIPRDAVVIPLWLHDHSGLSLHTGRTCQWDSGQIGFIYVDYATLREEYGVKRITKAIIEKAEKHLMAEIKTYDQYLSGDMYGFRLYEINTDRLDDDEISIEEFMEMSENEMDEYMDETDSCWGFYGEDFIIEDLTGHIGSKFAPLVEGLKYA